MFWNDLSSSKLISDNFTTSTDALVTTDSNNPTSKFLPQGKINKNDYIYTSYITGSPYAATTNDNTFILLGANSIVTGNIPITTYITPQDARNIDTKMDDGLPYTGTVFSNPWIAPAAPAAGVCVSTATTPNSYNTTISSYATTPSCYMHFKF